jgi:hypothetical protein
MLPLGARDFGSLRKTDMLLKFSRARRPGVACNNDCSSALSNAPTLGLGKVRQCRNHSFGIIGDDDGLVLGKQICQAVPAIADDRRAAGGCLE